MERKVDEFLFSEDLNLNIFVADDLAQSKNKQIII